MPRKSDVPSRIVRAAIALFSRQGYYRTSTRDIARLADVSEVTLYRYFEHKEDVFWAALSSCFDALKPRIVALQEYCKDVAPEVFLPRMMNLLMDTATYSPELVRLVAIALLEVRGKAEEVCRSHMSPLFTVITNDLQENVDTGSIRNLNPAIGTLGIALTVFAQPELSKLVEGCRLSSMDRREAVETYSQFWLGALLPAPEKHPRETFAPAEAVSA
jgi:AcrR family transcriptional regulator